MSTSSQTVELRDTGLAAAEKVGCRIRTEPSPRWIGRGFANLEGCADRHGFSRFSEVYEQTARKMQI